LGSGDIFRALIAGTSHHPEMALHLCLTDSSLSNVARNILLFSIVDKIGHDSSEEEVESLVSLLWEVRKCGTVTAGLKRQSSISYRQWRTSSKTTSPS